MAALSGMALLEEDEPAPVTVLNPDGDSPFLLTADHAGRLIPRALGALGVAAAELERHIAWDIGIAGVTRLLAEKLGAVAVMQNYSRLVMDCNRRPDVPSAYPAISETTVIPGNAALTAADKQARQAAIFDPYHAEIGRQIGLRGGRVIYLAMHSFTPVFMGVARPMQVAVLYNRNPRASRLLAGLLRQEPGLEVAENAPYRVTDETDYGVPFHAERNGLDYIEIEIRQDLIQDAAGQLDWAARLARLLPRVAAALAAPVTEGWR